MSNVGIGGGSITGTAVKRGGVGRAIGGADFRASTGTAVSFGNDGFGCRGCDQVR